MLGAKGKRKKRKKKTKKQQGTADSMRTGEGVVGVLRIRVPSS